MEMQPPIKREMLPPPYYDRELSDALKQIRRRVHVIFGLLVTIVLVLLLLNLCLYFLLDNFKTKISLKELENSKSIKGLAVRVSFLDDNCPIRCMYDRHVELKKIKDDFVSFESLKDMLDDKPELSLALKLNETQKEMAILKKNPVPIGFIYMQLAPQPEPAAIWPDVNWADVTARYSGLFFRAEGRGSGPFGKEQKDNVPRWIPVEANGNQFKNHPASNRSDLPADDSFSTGSDGKGNFRLRISKGEVRPRNMAIKIWKRVA